MIKETKKQSKYNLKKTKAKILFEYLKTVFCSILFAIIVTTFLIIRARNEMLDDIFASAQEQKLMDKKVAMEIITQTDLLENLKNKTYSVCMHAGEICEIASDYTDAQMAYELAIEKTQPNNYKPYYRLICVLAAQEKFKDADKLLENIVDITDKKLIKFKTRSYLTIGDKYYSIGKFLSAAKSYEKANFYYNKFDKKDKKIEEGIKTRIINSYLHVADIMVKSSLNSDAVRFLKKAEIYDPENFNIRYKLAIILSDLDPEKSVEYFEKLINEIPQNIDYGVYNRALMKSATIADLDNRPTQAKYYRYKIHSIDLFINRKVIYKNDIEINLKNLTPKKIFFKYPINANYEIWNISNYDLYNLKGDFILCLNDKELEKITTTIATKKQPLIANSSFPYKLNIKFKRDIFTKKELEQYTIKTYLYKDPKFKTLINENKILTQNLSQYSMFE